MVQPRIIEIEYHDFLKTLQHAQDSGRDGVSFSTNVTCEDSGTWLMIIKHERSSALSSSAVHGSSV